MASEEAQLRTRDGTLVTVNAEVARRSSDMRMLRAVGVFVGGVLLGAAFIPVPGIHLVAPWLIPLIALFIARYISRVVAVVGTVEGTCPSCDAPMSIDAGPVSDEALWLRCPSCRTPLEFLLEVKED